MSIKTRKIKLIAVGEKPSDKTFVYNYVKNIASELAILGNEIIRCHVSNQYKLDELSKNKKISKGDATKIMREENGTILENVGYQLTTRYPHIPSNIRTRFNRTIYNTISNNFYDILMGKISIPSFRKTNMTIPLNCTMSNLKNENGGTNVIYTENNDYRLLFPSVRGLKEKIEFSLLFGRDKSNNRIIVDRVISGEYNLCDSSIQVKDNDFYFLLTYKQPDTIIDNITEPKTMGIDIGINRPVSFYIENEKHQPQQIIIGEKIQHDRMRFYKQRRSLQQSLKFSKGGHGRTRKLQAINHLSEKEKNWSQTINHTITRELIKIAIDYKITTIKMEDLTGITTNSNDYFLKSWAYYQLQTYIEYKAKELGINIEWVNPKDTSNTCPTCKTSDPLNRNDKDKTKFRCINNECKDFDKEKDADIVGSFNICFKDSSSTKEKSKKGKLEKGKKRKEELLNV
jgi:IS605 OrfB family transposase